MQVVHSTFIALSLAAVSPIAFADDPNDEKASDEIVVYGRADNLVGEADSASEGVVGFDDIRLPPMLRVGELVESVPGMVATQHSGTGKANQYFIRGFNLDHGTDFAVAVDGVPVNMRSHGHGQGYLDLNFIIPELVEITHYRRGPYSAQVGDFSSAASVEFDLYDRLPDSLVAATVGEYGYFRALSAGSADFADATLTGAVDYTSYDGPWDLDEDLGQLKFFAGYTVKVGNADARITVHGYDSEWNATDQVPLRAVQSGQISPLGSVDDDLGGETSRYSVTGSMDFGAWSINAYAIDYEFSLYSNFTYFLDDPADGDEFEQRDDRRVYGIGLKGGNGGAPVAGSAALRWGADLRLDDINEVGLFRTSGRARSASVRQDQVDELSLGAWAEAEWAVTERLRTVLGVRADWYDWDVGALRVENSGGGNDMMLSPKATVAWRFSDSLETYVNFGRGFHSNDVRGATITIDPVSGDPVDSVPVLVRSHGAELGLRYENGRAFNATVTAFWLELDSELVYVGDAGTTEANDATRRIGFEGALFWQATDWLAVNAAHTRTDAEFQVDQGNGREIPGAVESTFTLGLNAAWESGWQASARVRWLGEAPLVEDGSFRSNNSLLINAGIGYRHGALEYRVDAFNLTNSDDYDISYFYASRLPGEPVTGVEGIHFHPLEPRSLRASMTYYWQ